MRESRSFYARWSRRKLESKTDSDVLDHGASTERDVDEEPAVPALTDAGMPALETLHDDSDHSGFLSPEVSDKSREVARRKIFHGKAFNIVDGLDDYDDNFITALPSGDIVTADMRHQAEIKLEKEKAALLEEAQRVATAEEIVDEELENDGSVAVGTSDVESEDEHENQAEAVNAVSQIDDDALLESVKRSPTSSGMMTPSDILAVDEFLAFSLPSDTAGQWARRDAIAKAMDSRQSTTALVGYRATGLVLIVGPEPYALSVAEELVGKVTLAILATEGNNASAGLEKTVFTREIDGQIILVVAADLMNVGGHLGAFEVTVDVNGEGQNLADLMNLTSQTFDVVLDLGREPAITLELPPLGYFSVSADRENMPKMLDEVAGLNGEFEKPQYVHYNPDICAHGERGITGCTRCIDTCPAGAVISIGERVEVDVHRCHGMGSCSAVCPTGALTYAYPSLSDTMNGLRRALAAWRISGMPAPCILLYDSDAGAEYLRTMCADFPDGVLPWPVEEVGSIGIEVWLSALAYGAVGIRILTHERTPGSVLTALAQQIELVRRLLEGLDHDGQSIAELPAVGFSSSHWPQGVDESVASDVATFGGVDNKRDALRLVLDHLTPESPPRETIALPAASPLGQIHVDTALCTLCMGCVSVCPAGALADGSDTPKLDFIEWNCVQCGLCERACPENAITLEARLLVDSEARLMKRNLNEEEPFGCIACGKPFATKSMIDKMAEKLASHRMFQGDALDRLKMCEDCRVKSMFEA